jgi:hypothetical protein
MNVLQMETKQEKTGFYFILPKQFEKEWRKYVADKYGGYHKGVYSKEVEAALRHYMKEHREEC